MTNSPDIARPTLTILCPCYNEEGVVAAFFDQLRPVIDAVSSRYSVRTVFLNNGSTDGTLADILELRAAFPDIYVLTFSRNVGYQRSLDTGLRNTVSDIYVFIDVDCEDPPSLIPVFLEKYEEGYDIVYGERVDREEPAALITVRKLFYRVLKRLADDEIILDMAEFGLFTDQVRDAIVHDQNSFPFIRSSISRVGFRRCAIPFKRHRRIGGETHYNLLSMLIFAVAGILSASTLFLRLPIYILPFWIVAVGLLALTYLTSGATWAAVLGCYVVAVYVGATLAFISLYVARSYKNGLRRPTAFISRRDTFPPPPALASHNR